MENLFQRGRRVEMRQCIRFIRIHRINTPNRCGPLKLDVEEGETQLHTN